MSYRKGSTPPAFRHGYYRRRRKTRVGRRPRFCAASDAGVQLRQLNKRIRALQFRPRMDAARRSYGKNRSRMARPAFKKIRSSRAAFGRNSRRRIECACEPRFYGPLAYRHMEAFLGKQTHQADKRQRRSCGKRVQPV